VEAIKRGIHVLVEKPFATSTREASAIVAAGPSSSQICVMHQYKFFEPFIRLRKAVAEHELGEITGARIFFGHGRVHGCWQGAIPDNLPIHAMHPFYILEWIFGTPTSVNGGRRGTNFYGQFGTQTGTINVDICQLESGNKHLFKVDVTGTDRSIEAADPPCLWWIGHNVRSDIRLTAKTYAGQAVRLLRLLSNYPLRPQLQYSLGTYDRLIKDFVNSIRNGSEPPATLQEALSSLKYAENYTTACNIGDNISL
jgi:predicted dehydrogenase